MCRFFFLMCQQVYQFFLIQRSPPSFYKEAASAAGGFPSDIVSFYCTTIFSCVQYFSNVIA